MFFFTWQLQTVRLYDYLLTLITIVEFEQESIKNIVLSICRVYNF